MLEPEMTETVEKSRQIMRAWPVLTLSMALLVGLGCSSPSPTSVSTPAPETGKDQVSVVNAADVDAMLKGARGKTVVVNLWATWCKPCVEEMPHFAKFYQEYSQKEVLFFALSVDAADDLAAVRRFHEEHKLPFPVYIVDERDPDVLEKILGTEISGAVPVTIFYDRKGEPRHKWEGLINEEELRRSADAIL